MQTFSAQDDVIFHFSHFEGHGAYINCSQKNDRGRVSFLR